MRIAAVILASIAMTTAAAAAPNPDRWDPLSTPERNALVDILKAGRPGAVTVACAKRTCAALATSVEQAFAAGTWKVTKVRSGGIGIDGVQGIRVAGCAGGSTGKIAEAVKKITSRSDIQVVVEPACSGDNDMIIVIGEKPE